MVLLVEDPPGVQPSANTPPQDEYGRDRGMVNCFGRDGSPASRQSSTALYAPHRMCGTHSNRNKAEEDK